MQQLWVRLRGGRRPARPQPIAAFTRGLGITSGGGGLADVGVPVAIMLGFAVVALLVSRWVPDRGRDL